MSTVESEKLSLHDACIITETAYVNSAAGDPWRDSPYRWIRQLSSRKKGSAGEKIIENWLSLHGHTVTRAGNSQSDRRVNGHAVEIKLSTEWENGSFTFQQIRDQEYTHTILFGVSPDRLRVWCVPKAVILSRSTGQHTGGDATETLWLRFPADDPPAWIGSYGGTETSALRVISESLKSVQ